MTDWTTCRVTPEMQAELRQLLDATETPWALWDGYGPDGNGDMRVARIGHLSGSGIRADPDSADIYGRREAFELLASAVNALPALLDAAAERDRLAEAVERVRALHIAHDCTSHAGIATICAHRPGICLACLKPLPCPTIRALDTTPETGGES